MEGLHAAHVPGAQAVGEAFHCGGEASPLGRHRLKRRSSAAATLAGRGF